MTAGQSSKSKHAREVPSRAQAFVFWVNLSLLVLVPLVFSAAVYNSFVLPKFVILLTGTSVSVLPLVLLARGSPATFGQLKSKHVVLFFGYLVAVSVSAIAGVDPVASFAGGYRRMGVLTELCFFVCFASLIVGIGSSKLRFERTLWAMVLTGGISAAYAVAQSFGGDPFIQPTLYTFTIEGESVVRAGGTLGHSNVLGNFLLYTTPVALGLAFASRGRTRVVALIATALSTAAVILSGTRGAWLGLAIAVAIFLGVARSNEVAPRRSPERRIVGRAVLAFLVVMGVVWVIGWNRASRGVILRARSIMTEHFTGAGRTLLWRDSIKVVPAAAITWYGPECFTKVFPAFGSMELAELSRLKTESSHNNYLDVAITEGLLGAALYAAITASTLLLLIRALRHAGLRRERFVIAGLVAAFVAVIVHNVFTYDHLSTSLYFFAFAALAQSASYLFEAKGSGRGGDFSLTDDRRPVTVVGHRSFGHQSSVIQRKDQSRLECWRRLWQCV